MRLQEQTDGIVGCVALESSGRALVKGSESNLSSSLLATAVIGPRRTELFREPFARSGDTSPSLRCSGVSASTAPSCSAGVCLRSRARQTSRAAWSSSIHSFQLRSGSSASQR